MAKARLWVVDAEAKCGGCGWDGLALYAIAETQEKAGELYKAGGAGICGNCMVGLLVEGRCEIGEPV